MRSADRSIPLLLRLALVAASVWMVVLPAWGQEAITPQPLGQADAFGGYPTTHIIIRFHPGVVEVTDQQTEMAEIILSFRQSKEDLCSTMCPTAGSLSSALAEICGVWNVLGLRRAYRWELADPVLAARFGLDRTYIVEVPLGTDTPAMAAAFAALEEIEFAEVDGIGGVAQLIPNDLYFSLLWGMHNTGQTGGVDDADIDAPEAWDMHTGDYGTVTVAVVDSGIDPHTEFTDRMLPGINTNDPAAPGLTADDCGHGTHVTGTLAAQGNNGEGVAGMTWGALIIPVRVLGIPEPCTGMESHCADGIIWATDNGADICNMSLQYYTGTQYLKDAVGYAHAQGVLLIAAAGNDHPYTVAFPAGFPNCMAVSATTADDLLWYRSNFGEEIDVCAPGEAVWSTWLGNYYAFMSGTSMASPHVSGLAALLKSYVPELTLQQTRNLLTATADDLGEAGWDQFYGYGRINAYSALIAVTPIAIIDSLPPDGAIDARQPSEIDGSDPQGWQSVDITFSQDAYNLTPEDFEVTEEGGDGSPPAIVAVAPLDYDVLRVVLAEPIELGAWTTITHVDSGTGVRLGYLPADVSGDAHSSPSDILTLIDALNDVGEPLRVWSTDIDRSDQTNPADVLREIDLLNGAGVYEVYRGMTLP